jgi:hypothetical protein
MIHLAIDEWLDAEHARLKAVSATECWRRPSPNAARPVVTEVFAGEDEEARLERFHRQAGGE